MLPHGGAIPPFYLFPTGQAYHAVCCAAEVLELVGPQQAAKIRGLLAKLARVKVPGGARAAVSAAGGVLAAIAGGAAGGGDKEEEEVRALQAALAGEIAGEDPRNGEVLLLMVDKPFVSEQDAAEVEAWSVQ